MRQQILDKITEFEAFLAKGEKAVAHIVQWAWSHLHAGGHVGSAVTGDVRARLTSLHMNAKNRMVAAEAEEQVAQAAPALQASPQPSTGGTPPAPSQPSASPDPNDKP